MANHTLNITSPMMVMEAYHLKADPNDRGITITTFWVDQADGKIYTIEDAATHIIGRAKVLFLMGGRRFMVTKQHWWQED